MKKKIFLIGLLVSAILLSGCIESTPSEKLNGELLKIAESTSEYEFSIYGDKIVWADLRNGNKDIYMYDLSSGKELQITSTEKEETSPTIYGNNIVYVGCLRDENKNGKKVCQKWALFLHNIDTDKSETIFTFDVFGSGSKPILYENNLVFSESRTNSGKLFLFDIQTKEKKEIINNNYTHYFNFDMHGNKIVWDDRKELNYYGIYVYDIETSETKRIAFDKKFRAYPKIHENKVVWLDRRNLGDADVYLYDLVSDKEQSFGGMGSNQVFPDIYENKIVWADVTSYPASLKGGQIHLYDLDKEKSYYLTSELNLGSFPKIYANNIVWQEFDVNNKQWKIYLFKVSSS